MLFSDMQYIEIWYALLNSNAHLLLVIIEILVVQIRLGGCSPLLLEIPPTMRYTLPKALGPFYTDGFLVFVGGYRFQCRLDGSLNFCIRLKPPTTKMFFRRGNNQKSQSHKSGE